MRRLGLLLLVLPLLGCGSYAKDLDEICFSPERISIAAGEESMKPVLIAEYLKKHVHTSQARALMDSLAAQDPQSASDLLRGEAQRAGLRSCPLADQSR